MATGDLIDNTRAIMSPTLLALNTSSPTYLAALITTASDAIKRYLNRDIALTTYTEYQNGGIYPLSNPLILRQYPVTEITRIGRATQALLVTNGDNATNQRATVETTTTGLQLVRVASAVTTTTSLLYATYSTLTSLATQIAATSGGWSATIQNSSNGTSFSLWPSSDLKQLQGAVSVFNGGAYLEIYEDISPTMSPGTWSSDDEFAFSSGYAWRLQAETGMVYGKFPRGNQILRIDYQAGYATVPQAIQEACVQYAAFLYQSGSIDYSVTRVRIGPFSQESAGSSKIPAIPIPIRGLLDPYKAYDRAIAFN